MQWVNDGHRILAVLSDDMVVPQVVCPGIELGERVAGLMCGLGTIEPEGAPDFCVVNEIISDLRWEGNETGLNIMIRDLIPIEYGWEDESIMLWKVCGYPTYEEVKKFREEASSALEIDLPGNQFPSEMFGLLPLKSWSEVDEETKEQLREDVNLHIENEQRKRRERHARQAQ